MSSSVVTADISSMDTSENPCPDTTKERGLQEIYIVGLPLEGIDSKITDLSADSKLIRADIAGIQDKVTDLGHNLHTIENKVAAFPDNELELQFLCNKLTDLEDRSSRDKCLLFWFARKKQRVHL
ncbi:hypothetical protein NDU88_007761 [Pleurodeles waltl]|uniref:Uncharacterized protein n=1 Tax=Pleurodeles waltl TaxID=8319 RepID=A0AAV7NVV4_PLEWA|nr:hypothetical protein NDU88_007761 [Pleurodeles waltl]